MSNQKVKAAREYVFRSKTGANGLSARAVFVELERIRMNRGGLRPNEVVDEARPDTAPLHPAFEWNDQVAAEEWRTHTARRLIRQVHVINEVSESEPVYVNVKSETERREYQPVDLVVNRPDLYGMAIYEAQQRINLAVKALEQLERAAGDSDVDHKHIAAIQIAMQALATASGAVEALH